MAFSPDGRRIVAGSLDGTAKVWDVASGRETLTLMGYVGKVTSIVFSPDGQRIVSGSEDKTPEVWDAATGQVTLRLHGDTTGGFLSVAFSPDGRWIASGGEDKTLRVWDAASGRQTLTHMGYVGRVLSVAFSPNGRQIASGSLDGTLIVCDAVTGHETHALKGHTGEVSSVAFSPDGKRIVSGSGDKTLKNGTRPRAAKSAPSRDIPIAFSAWQSARRETNRLGRLGRHAEGLGRHHRPRNRSHRFVDHIRGTITTQSPLGLFSSIGNRIATDGGLHVRTSLRFPVLIAIASLCPPASLGGAANRKQAGDETGGEATGEAGKTLPRRLSQQVDPLGPLGGGPTRTPHATGPRALSPSLSDSPHDQLGLVARDEWLGDAMPTEGSNMPFELERRTI